MDRKNMRGVWGCRTEKRSGGLVPYENEMIFICPPLCPCPPLLRARFLRCKTQRCRAKVLRMRRTQRAKRLIAQEKFLGGVV